GVYGAARARREPRLRNGAGTCAHALPFSLGVGFGIFELCGHSGRWAVLGVLFVPVAMALRGLFEKWARRAGWLIVTLVAAGATSGAYALLPGNRGYPVLGVAIGVGGIVHLLGDMVTSHGCPILWPIPP